MTNTKKAAKSVVVMIILILGSKFLGYIREALIAAKFGSGIETDSFFAAQSATGIFSNLIGIALNTTLIPIFSDIENKEGKAGKYRHTNNFLNAILLFSVLLVFIGWIFAPFTVKIIASGFKGAQVEFTVQLIRIGLPTIIFIGIVSVFRGLLQSELKFFESSFADFPYNLVYIIFLVFLSIRYGIRGLMVASVVAVASRIIIQIPGIKKTGYKYKFVINFKDPYLKKLIVLSVPILIGTAVNEIGVIIDKTLASKLVVGSISVLNYANIINNLIIGAFISPITIVLFPILSKEASFNINSMKKVMKSGVNAILLITIPATVGVILLAEPIVTLAFKRDAFDAIATKMTSEALICYIIGLVAMSLRLFITRVYYSLQDTKTPMINGVISVILDIILNNILVKFMAHRGLALSTSISTIVLTTLLLLGLKKKLGNIGLKSYIVCAIKSMIASLGMGFAVYILYYQVLSKTSLSNLILLSTSVVVGIFVYAVLCYILGVNEIVFLIKKFKQKITKYRG